MSDDREMNFNMALMYSMGLFWGAGAGWQSFGKASFCGLFTFAFGEWIDRRAARPKKEKAP